MYRQTDGDERHFEQQETQREFHVVLIITADAAPRPRTLVSVNWIFIRPPFDIPSPSLPVVRIFIGLAVLAWLSLVANFVVGLWIGDFNAAAAKYTESLHKYEEFDGAARGATKKNDYRDESVNASPAAGMEDEKFKQARDEMAAASAAYRGPRQRMTLHFYLGVASSILVILVNSVTVTYFVGTSRWCKEVAETYDLPSELQFRSTLLKRRTFPWAAAGMLAMVGLAALGGLSDPSIPLNQAQPGRSAAMVHWHYLAAMGILAFSAVIFAVQALKIGENYEAIQEILAEVQRIRTEKGLPVSDAA